MAFSGLISDGISTIRIEKTFIETNNILLKQLQTWQHIFSK